MPWPLALAQKRSPDKKPRTRICQELEENTRWGGGVIRETEGPMTGELPGDYRDLVVGQRRKRGVK